MQAPQDYSLLVSEVTCGVSLTVIANTSCSESCDGIITALAEGGAGNFDYLWNDGGNQTSENAIGLCAGSYEVTVTDEAGCIATATATIQPPPPGCSETSHKWYYDEDRDGYYTLVRTACCSPGTAIPPLSTVVCEKVAEVLAITA